MYILSGNGKEIINSEFVERFCIAEKEDATLIVASYGSDRPPITVGRYENIQEAKDTLSEFLCALAGGQAYYDIPASKLYFSEITKKDARVKRKGGS